MYCGNNALNPIVTSGQIALGTRYGCLRKGIGRGMNMPYDPDYLQPYAPIDQTVIYCGNGNNLPNNYDRHGNLPECLQKGVGIGKKRRAEQGPGPRIFRRYILPTIIWVILTTGLFCWLYFAKPVLVVDEEEGKDKKINWTKFGMFFGLSTTIVAIILLVVWRVF